MSSGYGIGAIGSYASDPAFLAAYSAYNPNFKASQDTTDAQALALLQAQAAAQGQGTSTQQSTATSNAHIAVPEPSDNTGMIVGGALATAAAVGGLIYAAKRGNGEGVMAGLKNIFGGAKKALSSEAAKETAKNAAKPLENIRIAMKGGKPVYYIPGRTTTTTEACDIKKLLADNKELKKLTGLRFNSGETTINGATFMLEDGGKINTITFDKDKIVDIFNDKGEKITDLFVKDGKLKTGLVDNDTKFAMKIEEYINKIRGGDTDLIFSKDLALADIHYTTKIGDNVAEVVRKGISRSVKENEPVITSLTTLKEFGAGDDAVKAYVQKLKEEGKDISAILSEGFLKKGKLPEGYKIASFDLPNGNKTIHVVDGKAVGISIDGKKQNANTFLAYKHDYEDAMNKMIKDALKDNNIPKGAIIVPQAA